MMLSFLSAVSGCPFLGLGKWSIFVRKPTIGIYLFIYYVESLLLDLEPLPLPLPWERTHVCKCIDYYIHLIRYRINHKCLIPKVFFVGNGNIRTFLQRLDSCVTFLIRWWWSGDKKYNKRGRAYISVRACVYFPSFVWSISVACVSTSLSAIF